MERGACTTCGGANCAFGANVIDQTDSEVLTQLNHHFPDNVALGCREGGGEWKDELRLRVALLKTVVMKQEDCSANHLRKVVENLAGTAAGEQANPGLRGIEAVLGGELPAAH